MDAEGSSSHGGGAGQGADMWWVGRPGGRYVVGGQAKGQIYGGEAGWEAEGSYQIYKPSSNLEPH